MRATGWAPAEWSEMISDELETSGTIGPMMKTMSNIFMMGSPNVTETSRLALNAPIATKVVCFSRLLKCLRSLYGKQCGPRSDCSYRSSLF